LHCLTGNSILSLLLAKSLIIQSSGTSPHLHLLLHTSARNERGEARFFHLGSSIDPATTSQPGANTNLSTAGTSLAILENNLFPGQSLQVVLLEFCSDLDYPPKMDPAAHHLLSVFSTKPELLRLKQTGQRTIDSKSWEGVMSITIPLHVRLLTVGEGFDTRIFSLSARKFPQKTPICCPYKLRSTFGEFDSFHQYGNQWNRRRQVHEQIEGEVVYPRIE
jgi:hypothetical protein